MNFQVSAMSWVDGKTLDSDGNVVSVMLSFQFIRDVYNDNNNNSNNWGSSSAGWPGLQ